MYYKSVIHYTVETAKFSKKETHTLSHNTIELGILIRLIGLMAWINVNK